MDETVAETLAWRVRGLFASEQLRDDACVLAARVLQLAAQRAGVACKVISCRVDILSPAWVEAARAGEIPQGSDAAVDMKKVMELRARGVWSVTIGDPRHEGALRPDGRRGFNAHLLAVLEGWLIDPTIVQASRPKVGIVLPPLAARVNEEFMARRESLEGETASGALLRYQRIAKVLPVDAPDWAGVDLNDPMVLNVAEFLSGVSGR